MSCSQLSSHTWSYAKDMNFESKTEMTQWIKKNWKIEVVHFTDLTTMKTEGTKAKDCRLCMQEKIQLFHTFPQKEEIL